MTLPLLRRIRWVEPGAAFSALARVTPRPHGLAFLDSGGPARDIARWSILAADPYATLGASADPFGELEAALARRPQALTDAARVPFGAGGAIGFLGYDLRHHLERLPKRHAETPEGGMWFGLYDLLAVFDREARAAWIVSTGEPEQGAAAGARAETRARWLEAILASAPPLPEPPADPLPPRDSLPPGARALTDPGAWCAAVERARAYIEAGDIYQANLSYRVEASCASMEIGRPPLSGGPLGAAEHLYLRLRALSPAPFGAFLDPGPFQIVSNSPERFLLLEDGRLETRPIKGTRPRSADSTEDARLARELLDSAKDQAENLMIVDLERNDLGRVAVPGSVRVERLAGLERYASVHHLVSIVSARLRPDAGPVDALRACFPGGSVTGAPKIRAMEIIEELETHPRGIYTGAIGGIDFAGRMDFSVAIRTAVVRGGVAAFHVGGGIVADSKPEAEYRETITKAEAFCRALSPRR